MSGRSWSGRWGMANREWQPRGRSAAGPILNRLAGREYRINEVRNGEWAVKWLDPNGDVVAWFGGDLRLVFVALQHLAERTESEFGIVVEPIWRQEPALPADLQALAEQASSTPDGDSKKPAKRPRQR